MDIGEDEIEIVVAIDITSSAPTLVPQGGLYTYSVEAEDADTVTGDVLTYSLTQSPTGMTIASQTGLIEWRPTLDSPRQAQVTVEVRDLLQQRATQSFTIVVSAEVLVVAANSRGDLYAARSLGDGAFGPLTFVDKISFNAGGVALADFDGDGDFDFVTGYAKEPQAFVYFVENKGAQFASPALIAAVGDNTTPSGRSLQGFAAADVNADGLMDFALNGGWGSPTTWLFQRNGALVFGQEALIDTDFEVDAGGWINSPYWYCSRSDVALDGTTSNSGSQSMRVFATASNACLAAQIDPASWAFFEGNVLTFAYRIPPGVPVGLMVEVGSYGSLFLGGTPTADSGSRTAVQAVQLIDDDQWHTATIDLAQTIRSQWPEATRIDHLEWYTQSNAPAGAQFWFDDVRVTHRTVESGFAVSTLPVTGGDGRGLAAADVNGDGHVDFVQGDYSSSQFHLYQGDGTGQFTTTLIADVRSDPRGVALADFDSDGTIDLISNQRGSGIPIFFKGNGDGAFQAAQPVPSLIASNFAAYSPYDFDLDGRVDLALIAPNNGHIQYFQGNGDATFGTPVILGPSNSARQIAAPVGHTLGQPVGIIVADQTDVAIGDPIAFDASGSYDNGSIVEYTWDFGDGTTAIGLAVNHTFTGEGVFIVTLTLTDDTGQQERRGIPITVRGNPPVADPGGPYVLNESDAFNGRWPLPLNGSGSSDAESSVVRYEWDFDATDGVTVNATGAQPRHVYTATGTYTVTLTVYDAVNQPHTATTTVTVNAGAVPVAALSAPAVVDETAASLGTWAVRADLRATTDDVGMTQYRVDWGDGTSTTIDALRETFEDGEIAVNPAWTVRGGTWEVINGEVHQTDVSSGWKWLQDLSRSYRDFVLEVDFEGVSSGGQMGIAFRQPNTSGNAAAFQLWSDDDDNTWRLLDWNATTELAAGGSGWDPGIRYHLRLVVVGRTIQLFVTPEGGTETLQLEANSLQHPVGGIALMAHGQHLIYDNLRVTPIADSLQPMHLYVSPGDYTITLSATDVALQSGTATAETHIQANAPPVAEAGGPYVLTEADAFGGRWTLEVNASASSDDHGVQRYTLDFGDGNTGTGVAPSHSYTTPGTYVVTLVVTDHAGQQTTTTFNIEVTPTHPPVAETGGPYIFGEEAAEFGVWTVVLDARGSSDDAGILDYEWILDSLIVTRFDGTHLDTQTWLTTEGTSQADAVTITGTGQYGTRYLFSTQDVDRREHLVYQARVTTVEGASPYQSHVARWGFKNSDPGDFSPQAMPHAIGFHNGSIAVYDNNRYQFGIPHIPYDIGDVFDVRMILKPSGAIYEIKRADAAVWTRLFESDQSTDVTPLKIGLMVEKGTYTLDDVRLEERYFTPQVTKSYTALGTHDATLHVRDHALQHDAEQTTFTIAKGDPPVARPGGPYALAEGHYGYFVGTASTDDDRIARYDWDFGNGGTSTQPNPVRYYDPPGVFEVTLTVTDHALQTHQQTAIIRPRHVQSIDLSNVVYDWQALDLSGTIAADITNPDNVPLDPFQVVFFEDTNNNRVFDAAQDSILATASHGELGAGETVQVSTPINSSVRFRDTPILAFMDTGLPQAATDPRHYSERQHACRTRPPVGDFNPTLLWKWDSSAIFPERTSVLSAIVIDLTDDGRPEVVFSSFRDNGIDAYLRAVDGATGQELFTVTDENYALSEGGQLSAGDIDGDGRPEIIAVGRYNTRLIAFEHDGTFKWRSRGFGIHIGFAAPALADLNRDGTPEIIVGSIVLDATGALMWHGELGIGAHPRTHFRIFSPVSLVANLDLEGDPEVVAGNTAYRSDGSIYWHNNMLTDGFNAVGNFDADPFPELVLVTVGQVYLLEHDGTVIWGPVPLPAGGRGGPPTVGDVDQDGQLEIGVSGRTTYTMFETDGSVKWSSPIVDFTSNVSGSTFFDFEGDGKVEVIHRDEDNLQIFRGLDGSVKWTRPSTSATAYDYPVVADVDSDGRADLVVFTDDLFQDGEVGVQVYSDVNRSWSLARSIWNQHSYHITNINDDGSIPVDERPSWLEHNSYRMNQAPNSIGADLTASFVRLTQGAGDVTLTARLGNAGILTVPAGVNMAFYDGDPQTGGALLGVATTTTSIAPDTFEDITLTIPLTASTAQTVWVAADDDGTQVGAHHECTEDNNLHDSGLQVITNQPPVAVAGGPYNGIEGVDLPLDGSGSSDPNGDTLSFAWDLDNNGDFDDATGATPQVSVLDDSILTVALQVSDGPETATDTATVTIINADPVVEAGADQTVSEGSSVSLSGASFNDSGSLDTHTATVDWGDGTTTPATVTEANGTDTVTASHVYTDNGTFTVTLTVTDDDGGVGTDTLVVTVSDVEPVVDAGADQTVTEGTTVAFTGSFNDPGADTHTISWDFGDGDTSTGTLTPTHLFDQNNAFTVTLTVTDDDGGIGTDTLTITVTNVAPVIDAIADQAVADGSEFVLTANFSDPGQDTQTVVVDWGDGTSDSITVGPEAGGTFTAPHTYPDDGVFTVTVTVTDESGGTDSQTFTLTVNNVVPIAEAGADQTAAEGSPVSFTGSLVDPGNDTHTISWDFGDGTVVTGNLNPTHTYTQDGVFTATLTITDDDGAVDTDTLTVTVTNVAPIVDAIADQTVADGSEFALTATFNDPGDDTQTVTIDWGDGNSDSLTVGPEAGGTFTAPHTYPDDGVFTVTVTVTDESGGTDTQAFTVTVNNVVPVAEAGADQTVTEGSPVFFTGSFNDPGHDTHTFHWDFGDGTVVTDTLNPSHIYTQDGVFTVTLTITDDDGGVGTDTSTVTVTNVSPMVDTIPDQTVADGSELTLTATFNDPGHDTQTVVIDWGDGSPTETQTVGPEAGGNITATHPYAGHGVFTVTLTVTDDDGGSDTQSFTVTVENVTPVVNAGANQSATEGDVVTFNGSFSDPGINTHTITWDFGDGTRVNDTLNPTHVYEQDGIFTVTLTITDDDSAAGTDTLVVTVVNATPVVAAGPDQSTAEGTLVELTGASFSDVGGLDVHTATVDWGDGTTTPAPMAAGNVLSASHTYSDNGVFTATITVTDEAGASGVDQFSVTVANVAPVVNAGGDQTVSEGATVSFAGSFIDASAADTHSVSWNFGDGTTSTGLLTPSHTYAQDGVYTATLTVTDDDGGTGTDTLSVLVNNATPVVTAAADQTIQVNENASLAGTAFTDAGLGDVHTASVDWGDGTTEAATVIQQSGGGEVEGTHTYSQAGVFDVVITVEDEMQAIGIATLTVTVEDNVPPTKKKKKMKNKKKGKQKSKKNKSKKSKSKKSKSKKGKKKSTHRAGH